MPDTRPEWSGLTDQEVVLLARAGQEAAYRELIRRYERPVFALLFRMVRDRELAEDLAQKTFVKALNAIDSYRPEFKFSSWIFKIGNNAAIDHLRRRELDTLSLERPLPPADAPRVRSTALAEALDVGQLGSCARPSSGGQLGAGRVGGARSGGWSVTTWEEAEPPSDWLTE